MNDIETDAAELRKTADYYDGVAGRWLAALTTEQYAERLKRLSVNGDRELAIHKASIAVLPPYVVTALREGNARTLNDYRNRRGSESLHLEVESWYHLEGGRETIAARNI
jgi:hypothetical protein